MRKNELLRSAIPARALYLANYISAVGHFELVQISAYQARNAARIPNAPPARRQGMLGSPAVRSAAVGVRYAIPSIKKARSRVKNSRKKATVDRRVQMSRMKVKMNQP